MNQFTGLGRRRGIETLTFQVSISQLEKESLKGLTRSNYEDVETQVFLWQTGFPCHKKSNSLAEQIFIKLTMRGKVELTDINVSKNNCLTLNLLGHDQQKTRQQI